MEMMVGQPQQRNNHHRRPSMETDKLNYEIFSILESKFLFGYDDPSGEASPAMPPKNQRGKVRILAIDAAAGMRAVVTARALSHLEQALRTKSGDPNATIADYFDLAAGSGVGGVFAAMLFSSSGDTPRRAEDTVRFVAEKGRRFLTPERKSSSRLFRCAGGGGSSAGVKAVTAAMEESMKDVFGETITLRDTVKPVLIPCYDMRSSAPFVFSRAAALESESYNFRLWEVCRATAAEPGRAEPVELRSVDGSTYCVGVDGGLAMSNPAAAAITHVLHNKQEFPFVRGVEDLLVLSVGAGGALSASVKFDSVRRWRAKDWARPIARIAADGAADLVDNAVAMAFSHCRSSNNYTRIQANLSGTKTNMEGDLSPGNVKKMMGLADEMLKQKYVESVLFGGMKRVTEPTNSEKLDWFAGELVLEHQRRSNRIAPTVAFKRPPPPHPT